MIADVTLSTYQCHQIDLNTCNLQWCFWHSHNFFNWNEIKKKSWTFITFSSLWCQRISLHLLVNAWLTGDVWYVLMLLLLLLPRCYLITWKRIGQHISSPFLIFTFVVDILLNTPPPNILNTSHLPLRNNTYCSQIEKGFWRDHH